MKNVTKGTTEWYIIIFILIAVLVVSRYSPSQTLPPVLLPLHIHSALNAPNEMPTRKSLKRGISRIIVTNSALILFVWTFQDVRRLLRKQKSNGFWIKSHTNVSIDFERITKFDRLYSPPFGLIQAGLEDLVHCPFCSFAAVLDKFSTEFECLQCGVKSCRHCRVKSHRPATCKGTLLHYTTDIRISKRNRIDHPNRSWRKQCLKQWSENAINVVFDL